MGVEGVAVGVVDMAEEVAEAISVAVEDMAVAVAPVILVAEIARTDGEVVVEVLVVDMKTVAEGHRLVVGMKIGVLHLLAAETMADAAETMADAAGTMADAELITEEGVLIMEEGVGTMKIALVETEVGTTEDMEAESAVGLLREATEGVVTEVNREVIDMGLQECQPRASPLQGRGSTPAAQVPVIAATPLVLAQPRRQVASERYRCF